MRRLAFFLLVVALPALAQAPAPAPAASPEWQTQFAGAFWAFVFPLLLTGLFGLVLWALSKLIAFLHLKAAAEEQRGDHVKVFGSLEKLALIVQHEVADAEVTLKPKLAQAMADGKLSPEEGKALRDQVLDRVKTSAGPALLGVVKDGIAGNLDGFLGGMLEKAVATIPSSGQLVSAPEARPTAPSAPVPPAP